MEEKELFEFENSIVEEAYLNLLVKKEGNEDIFDELVKMLELLEKSYDYKTILSIIEDNFSYLKNDDERLYVINKKIVSLLRLEEFNLLLETLEYKSALENLNNTEKTNILFYKAIALEALDEIDLSIKALEDITDNISRYSLVNKYLKLALLYIKASRKEDAKKAYDYASLIDYNHKNDMFYLVESDLFYESKKYADALDSFTSFFLKSPNKYKYLDRYIKINIKLDRLEEAYNFYTTYKDKPSLKLSTENRYQFFKAVKELLVLLDKKDELNEINSTLENLKPVYFKKEESEVVSLISLITKEMSIPLTRYDKRKNIANRFFKLLNNIKKNVLVFIERTENGYMYSLFNNTQLKENEISYSMLKESELEGAFKITKDTILDSCYNQKLEKIDETVKCYQIKNEYHDYGYFFISYDSKYDAIYSVLRDALLEVFFRLDSIVSYSTTSSALLKTSEEYEYGFISIKSSRVEFYNNLAKEIFNVKKEILTYSEFSNLFIDKDFYPDDFLKEKTVILKFNIDNKEKLIEFKSSDINGTVYSLIKDVTKSSVIESQVLDYYYHSGLLFFNENKLKERIENISDSFSLMGLNIGIIENSDSIQKRRIKLNGLYNYLDSLSNNIELYYGGENHVLILSNQIDKRVLESLYSRISDGINKLYKYTFSLRDKKITGFMSKSLKNKSYTEVLDLIEYGFNYSSIKNDFIILDNDEKKNYALYKTYDQIIANMIKNNELEIEYYPIIDRSNNSIHYFMSKYKLPFDIDYTTFEKIVSKNDLESKIDYSLIEKTFTLDEEINKNMRYIIPVHKDSLMNQNFIKKIQAFVKDKDIKRRLVLNLDIDDHEFYKKSIQSLKNIGLRFIKPYKNISNIKEIEDTDMVFLYLKGNDEFLRLIVSGIKNILNKEVIVVGNEYIEGALSLKDNIKVYDFDGLKKL